jgi:glutamate-ammonia-ligase adenylyltransferase
LKANPNLLRLIANIMGSTPRLARILSRRRRLLDAVLDPQALQSDADHGAIDSVLEREFDAARRAASGDPMQDILDTARIVGSEQSFLVGVRLLSGTITAEEAGAAYAMIAERLVAALLKEVTRELEADHGCIPGGAAAVIAMGKLGGCEMTASSDIDLMLVYSCDADAQQSDGPKPLAPSHYYGRLTQRLINAIAAPTAQGALYEVDMRLRPSGQKGPVATRLSSFKFYQETEAWTWEHMALTRARVIAGPDDLKRRVEADIRAVLTMPRDSAKIAADVRDMRQRIASEKGTDNLWDLKQARGGLVDLEFIAQYLQLVHAARHPKVLNQNTLTALGNMVAEGVLERQVFITLNEAGRLLHDLTQILRLSLDHAFEPKSAPAGLKALLAQAASEPSFSALEARLKDVMAAVYEAFDALIQPA